MSRPELVIAMYRPKLGKLVELGVLVQKHFPVLKEYGLVTKAGIDLVDQNCDERRL